MAGNGVKGKRVWERLVNDDLSLLHVREETV